MALESREDYVKRAKESITQDVIKIARLKLNRIMIDSEGGSTSYSQADADEMIKMLNDKCIREAMFLITSVEV